LAVRTRWAQQTIAIDLALTRTALPLSGAQIASYRKTAAYFRNLPGKIIIRPSLFISLLAMLVG